jgi:hypothetical protein
MFAPPRLRGYVIEGLLGRGATGDVWQARVGGGSTRVAVKRIPVRSADQLRRAQDEAALLAALDHENLVRLHALLPGEDAMVLVLDLARGGSLAELLAARSRLTPGEVITAIAPVAAAVAYLHEAGVVHGDISPGNILFNAAGAPLLSDVGVARLTGDDAAAAATPAYVDPAVAAGWVPGPQSDVFMLGAVALHALTGTPPWPDPEPDAALARAARAVLDDVAAQLNEADVPDAMAAAVCRALSVDPQHRGTAADFALDLRHGGQPVAVELAAGRTPAADRFGSAGPRHAASIAPPTRMVAPRPRPAIPRPAPRRRVRLPLIAAAAVLAAAAVAVVLVHRPDGAPTARAISTPRVEVETLPARTRPPTQGPTRQPTGPPTSWLSRLDALDAFRARAYATRDVSLLRRVYARGDLLRSDAALLTRLVPDGCGLSGARTRYADPVVRQVGQRVRITVLATLRPSRLICAGRVRARAPGRGPSTLDIVVVPTAAGPRIATQRVRPVRALARRHRLRAGP